VTKVRIIIVTTKYRPPTARENPLTNKILTLKNTERRRRYQRLTFPLSVNDVPAISV